MKMQRMKTTALLTGICMVVMSIISPVDALAVDTVTLPLEVYGKDVVSVALPAISEGGESPFDFVIDPQGLIFATDAAKYGGGKVEEGATILFRNHEGEYDFSRRSDALTVKNRSNVPVVVTVTASIENLGDIEISGNTDFGDSDVCGMYLAVVDDEGNEKPISEDGEISISTEMHRAPDDAYVYRIDEENGSYSYELSRSPEEIDFDSYSFGLTGYCNPNGNWQDISVHPVVRVTWKVEPVLSEEEEAEQLEELEEAATAASSEQTEEQEEAKEPESDTSEVGEKESEQNNSETTEQKTDAASTGASVVEKRPVLGEQVDTEQASTAASVIAPVEEKAEEASEDEVTALHDNEPHHTQESTDTSESMQPPAQEENATNTASDEQ
ncbi:hypothetical protein [Butyrivibrio sp. M55]|uniref:hypothetical protein n=1 Tax=Butyrivibrio sp. M55 TaxID=1855323 RepID=UPI0008EE6F6A|nr:hypothetical protein [Butyrivibrio sp. M55]SFU65948.1 hypothetical protein SAMN05216540_105149 [Butyrivibrio sp. M55]